MTDALSLLEDGISELNKENSQEQDAKLASPDALTQQQAKQLQSTAKESEEIDESKPGIHGEQKEELEPQEPEPLPMGLIPPERSEEITQEVDQLDGLTENKNLKMKREWIIRERTRLDEIEQLKAMAREADERRKRYLSLRHVSRPNFFCCPPNYIR